MLLHVGRTPLTPKERETIFWLPHIAEPLAPPKPQPGLKPQEHERPQTGRPEPAIVLPRSDHSITLPPAALKQLGQSLFGCAPEKLVGLTAEERARCHNERGLGPDNNDDFSDRSARIPGAALFAREKTVKNVPLLLPCMNPYGFAPLYTLGCAAKTLMDGKYDPNARPVYGDKPEAPSNPGGFPSKPLPTSGGEP